MYDELLSALKSTGIPTAEGDWDRAPQSGPYLILRAEFEPSALWGDGHKQQQAIEGSVHLFERSASRANFLRVQSILDSLELSWRYSGTQTEPRNGIIHYDWVWRLEVL